jgi:hypothetical protein
MDFRNSDYSPRVERHDTQAVHNLGAHLCA